MLLFCSVWNCSSLSGSLFYYTILNKSDWASLSHYIFIICKLTITLFLVLNENSQWSLKFYKNVDPFYTLLTLSYITISVSLLMGISPKSGAIFFFLLNTTIRSQGTMSCLLYFKCFLMIIEFIAFQYSVWIYAKYNSQFGYYLRCSVICFIFNFWSVDSYESPSVGILFM